ncbi:hypothetical protein Anas_11023 [Armadillidium nasatum]|uniref:Uncharacterized protein n=1 Tax=Armadillidium nasatum TaxID=96803 RepID=A0A5N5SKI4_9CRUS|nr:hypothetical protein Anas_11023 [Armadillidium nasatum]
MEDNCYHINDDYLDDDDDGIMYSVVKNKSSPVIHRGYENAFVTSHNSLKSNMLYYLRNWSHFRDVSLLGCVIRLAKFELSICIALFSPTSTSFIIGIELYE